MTRSAMIVPPLDNRRVRSEDILMMKEVISLISNWENLKPLATRNRSIETEVSGILTTYMHARPPPLKVILVRLASKSYPTDRYQTYKLEYTPGTRALVTVSGK